MTTQEQYDALSAVILACPDTGIGDTALAALRAHANDTVERHDNMTKLVETMDTVRLDMKYIIYDLECTKRERDNYKKQLEK